MGKKATIISSILGNALEHYDSAIFGILAPFIAQVFFCDQDPFVALIMTYLLIPLGLIMRPLGALFFGRIGDQKGRALALSYSLVGMAISTMTIGCLPTYSQVGLISPALLLVCRLLQGFFAAGETSGGAIYLLENSEEKKRDFMSSIFDSSTIIGIFIASLLVTLFAKMGIIDTAWRYLFWMGGFVALFGAYLRRSSIKEIGEHPNVLIPSTFEAIKKYRGPFIAIIITAGFSHATYTFPFTLCTGFIPLISNLSRTQLIEMNTQLLVFDLFMLPFFGLVATRFGRKKVMTIAAGLTAIITPLCFVFLDLTSLVHVLFLRGAIVTFGVAFAAAYHSYAVSSLPMQVRYTLISLGSSLGALVLGKPVAAISMALYAMTGSIPSVGIYFSLLAALATICVLTTKVRDRAYDAI